MNFSLFRLPNTQQFFLAEHQPTPNSCVSFFAFDKTKQDFSCQNLKKISQEDLGDYLMNLALSDQKLILKTPSEAEYLQKVEKTKLWLQQNSIAKLVISRPLDLEKTNIDFLALYLKLCQDFPQTLCYAYYNNHELWMGASPELLGHYNKKSGLFSTMSLAGTLSSEKTWSEKEIQEQAVVSQYIAKILNNYCQNVEMSETFSHHSGNIKHLRNDFKAYCSPDILDDLLNKLHPTPAICGFPAEICLPQILETEAYDRSLYAGKIRIETETDLYYFVNLRCAQFNANQSLAYVGGGINHLSIAQNEWHETQLKAQVFTNRI